MGAYTESRCEICQSLQAADPGRLAALFDEADRVRARTVGNAVHLRALIEISNVCGRDCLYCGLRKSNTKIRRCRMADHEIIAAVRTAVERGRKSVVLQSGEDPLLTTARIVKLITEIKSQFDVAITLSLGEYHRDDYSAMRAAGADRYLLKHETIEPDLYRRLHPDMSYDNRIRCLTRLKDTGFQVGSGFMVGLPGQTVQSLADDILFLKKMKVDMAGVGPFRPHPDTPLAAEPPGSLDLTLKVVALMRIAMPWLLIPATTAVATSGAGGLARALNSGANVIMPNGTPEKYRRLYEIYPDRARVSDTGDGPGENVESLIALLGRTIARDYGHGISHVESPHKISIQKQRRLIRA